MKQFFILLLTSSLIIAQKTEDKFFSNNETLEAKISFTPKTLKKSTVDTIYFDTNFAYKIDDTFQEMEIGLRARGNFRRNTCYFPPIKMKIKKIARKGTLFEGNKNLKLVLPCKLESDKNDNILKEYMAYKLYEQISPYHFNVRRVDIEFSEIRGKKEKVHQLKGFLIEDDKVIAKRFEGRVVDRFIHPLAMDATVSVQNAIFNFMLGNTDISVAYQHNAKLLYIDKKLIPLSYDFDMSGFVNPSYATVNETLGINSVRDRKYRGFKRDTSIMQETRELYVSKKDNLTSIVESHKSQFDSEKEYKETIGFLNEFYEIIEDDKSFQKEILDAMRTK
jgi:hypothetical protein